MGNYKGVQGGTIGGIPLCRTCRNAQYIQGAAESQKLLMCDEYGAYECKPMPFEAYECTKYDDKRYPSRHDFEQTAWILRTNPKQKGTLGFFSPTQLKEFRRKDLIGDDED